MGKIIFSFATAQILSKAAAFASVALVFQAVPLLLGWLFGSGFEFTATGWNVNIFHPMANALQFAPAGFRWFVWYFYLDLSATIYVTALVWGFVKDIIVTAR